ncbi:MAG: hypothetical protein WBM07_15230 [Chitinivibrionales bacterium]
MPDPEEQSAVEFKTFTITVETPDGKLPPATINVPEVPLGLADLAPLAFGLEDGIVGLAVRNALRSGRTASCRRGCGACCCQMVPVSAPEAIYIMEAVLSGTNNKAAFFMRRFAQIRAQLNEGGLWERLRRIDSTKDQSPLAAEYWERRAPCPFLLEDSCSIHLSRPCACREYTVTSEPSLCSQLLSARVERIKIHKKMTTALAKTAGCLLSTPPQLVPLVTVPEWYEEHREAAGMRWMGSGLFDLFFDCAFNAGEAPDSGNEQSKKNFKTNFISRA